MSLVIGLSIRPSLRTFRVKGRTEGAIALYISVRQEPLAAVAVEMRCGRLLQISLFEERVEEILRDRLVVVGVSAGVQVELDAQVRDGFGVHLVVPVGYLLWTHLQLVRADGDGGSVHVRPRDHDRLVPDHAVEPREDVRRESRPRHVAALYGP